MKNVGQNIGAQIRGSRNAEQVSWRSRNREITWFEALETILMQA